MLVRAATHFVTIPSSSFLRASSKPPCRARRCNRRSGPATRHRASRRTALEESPAVTFCVCASIDRACGWSGRRRGTRGHEGHPRASARPKRLLCMTSTGCRRTTPMRVPRHVPSQREPTYNPACDWQIALAEADRSYLRSSQHVRHHKGFQGGRRKHDDGYGTSPFCVFRHEHGPSAAARHRLTKRKGQRPPGA
jgi:hypothetical protein